jgi:hypothetical protein
MTPLAPPDWMADLRHRMLIHLPLKLVGVSAFMWVFFAAYFHLLRYPVHPVTTMPLTWLDHATPFQPYWLGAYLSLWVYTGVAPGLMLRVREMAIYGVWAAGMCLSGLVCFYLWPTAVPHLALDVSGYPGFQLLRGVDAAGNACPSLHVAAAVFTAVWIERVLRTMAAAPALRWGNGLWAAAIVYSTLAVKQHVVWDAVCGAVLGGVWAWVSLRHTRVETEK